MSDSRALVSVCVVVVGLLAGAVLAVNIATVPVDDPGNKASSTGRGSVAYAYNIGKYEVTAGQYTEFLNKVGGVDTYGLYGTWMSSSDGCGITRNGEGTVDSPYTYSVASDFVNRPVNYVSYWDCCRFTNWLSNGQPSGAQGAGTTDTGAYTLDGYNGEDGRTIQRNGDWKWALPSEDEWYKAAYYKGGSTNAGYWLYPTRSNTTPGRDMDDASGNNANYYSGTGTFPIDSGKYYTVVGEFQNSVGPYGTFDQGGNVWERNESMKSVPYGLNRGTLGGAANCDHVVLQSSTWTSGFAPYLHASTTGFRVVLAVPEPASLGLVLVGGLMLLKRWRWA